MEFTGYNTLWKAIIRPPKCEYEVSDLGPAEFVIDHMKIKRTDMQIKNHAGLNLECSHFEPFEK